MDVWVWVLQIAMDTPCVWILGVLCCITAGACGYALQVHAAEKGGEEESRCPKYLTSCGAT
eukprot:355093-Chlamydomonas_euryale.AAC.9